jgi:hypothetical protein
MKNIKIYFWTAICCIMSWSCQRENDINQLPPSNLRTIVSFVLNPYHNEGNVYVQLVGTIDELNKLIKLEIPGDLRLDSIRPDIVFAPWATISPKNLEYIDLRADTVKYTVTAQSGKKAVYSVVKDRPYVYGKTTLYAVSFTNIIDTNTGIGIRGVYYSAPYTITMTVPKGTDITKIMTNLEFAGDSQGARVIVKENGSLLGRNFTSPGTVDYTKQVTFIAFSQDGSNSTSYFVIVKSL